MFAGLLLFVVIAITCAICVSDFKSMRIPNWHSLLILGLFVLAFAVSPESFGKWWHHIGAFVVVFLVTYVMFVFGVMGGGDTKLASVLALWIGLKGIFIFMFFMALIGGVLGLVGLIIMKRKLFKNAALGSWLHVLEQGKSAVPYGIALSAGFWISIFHTPYLHEQIHEVIKIIHS